MNPTGTLIVSLALITAATAATADSHGNDLVHSREFRGSVYMMNQTHMTLYVHDGDSPSFSTCTGECAETWPPALLPEGSQLGENYTLFRRDDGTMQIAYKGRPLYLYSGDARVGETNGDGIGGIWSISRPTE
jgi:predicted lipoprotein with Yx(FWY)xxD motif